MGEYLEKIKAHKAEQRKEIEMAENKLRELEIKKASVEERIEYLTKAIEEYEVNRAKERKRDYTVDWVHLKLNDQAQRTVLCKDPFKSRDERVEKLISSL